MSPAYVYLIEAQNGVVKIGWSVDPVRRAKTIAGESPVMVRLAAFWPGEREDELALHERFADQWHHLEWFSIVGPVRAFLAEKRGLGIETVPAWDDLTFHSDTLKASNLRVKPSANGRAVWERRRAEMRAAASAPLSSEQTGAAA